jgi:hypothetical protein
MEVELLADVASGSVPDDGALVDRPREQQVSSFVPLKREDWALVLVQSALQLALLGPDARLPVVRARRK